MAVRPESETDVEARFAADGLEAWRIGVAVEGDGVVEVV
jgi:hypothetical protein